MTVKEKEVLQYIVLFKTVNHYPPTIREIADGIHTASLPSVKEILERLREQGIITYHDKKPRTIVVKQFHIDE